MLQLLVTAAIISSLLSILYAVMMEAIHSFKMLVVTRATWHHIPGHYLNIHLSGYMGHQYFRLFETVEIITVLVF
jgi:hypothetical protein